MKPGHILLTIVISLLTAVVAATYVSAQHKTGGTAATAESAYDRVMRTRTLRCGYSLWPVTEDIDPATKQMKGIAPDFTKALGEELGLKIEWVEEVPIDQTPEALKSGRFDALCATDGPWSYTETAFVDWTMPMVYFPVYLYGRKGETRFSSLESLNRPDVTFSTIDGDISLTIAAEKFPKANRLALPGTADPSLVVRNVLSGKADVLLEDALTVDRTNDNNGEKLVKIRPEPFAVISMSFTTRKGDESLRQMLNQGFALLQARGISDQILDHYDPEHKLFLRPQKPWQQ